MSLNDKKREHRRIVEHIIASQRPPCVPSADPIVDELRGIGFPVNCLSDLYQFNILDERSLPVLLHWLERDIELGTKEELVLALRTKWARGTDAPLRLIGLYDSLPSFITGPGTGIGFTIGQVLEYIADDRIFADLLRIVRNRNNGFDRGIFLTALCRMKRQDPLPFLLEALADPIVRIHAIRALGRLNRRAIAGLPTLRAYSADPDPSVARAAVRVIAKLESYASA